MATDVQPTGTQPEAPVEKLTVTIAQAAKMVGISDGDMREIVKKDNSFPAFKNKSCTLIPREGLKAWVEERGKLRWGMKTSSSEVSERVDRMREADKKTRKEEGIAWLG